MKENTLSETIPEFSVTYFPVDRDSIIEMFSLTLIKQLAKIVQLSLRSVHDSLPGFLFSVI